MLRLRPLLALSLAATFLACQSGEPVSAAPEQSPGEALYSKYCIGCHGPDLKGGTASNLLKADLKYGSSRQAIYDGTAKGYESVGMPGFGKALSPIQLNDLTDYILAKREGQMSATAVGEVVDATKLKRHRTIETLDYKVDVDIWIEGLDTPWSIAFTGDGRALVTEKRGRLRVIEKGALQDEPVKGTPTVDSGGQGGLLDVAVDPDFARNGWVYLSYSHEQDRHGSMTRVVRGKITDNAWTGEQVLFEAPAETYRHGGNHYGSRFVFDGKGHLFFSIGERGNQKDAQDITLPNGKVHRINLDGSIPKDNPFVGADDAIKSIYSYGHRNPQGLDMHPVTGDLWDAEHGPRGGDELNIVRSGKNYGWPVISYGINYDGSIMTRERVREGMEQPIWFWRPSTGVCAIEFYEGTEFPYWQNQLLVSSLARRDLRLLTIEEGRVLHEEVILKDMGRVRDVSNGPDGAIYVVLNDPGTILRLSSGGEALQ